VGRFLLRIDDTDAERSREEYVEAIRADLAWLGLVPRRRGAAVRRFALYEREFARLVEAGGSIAAMKPRRNWI
jgi:glutamyl-tRNA synthetase